MGNQTSTIQFPKNTWRQFRKQGNLCIYHNCSGLYAQKKQLTQDKKLEAKQELKIYKQRSQTNLPIVKVYNVDLTEQKKNFCSTLQKMTVWIQYIPNKLSLVKAFTLGEGDCLYVLRQSLKGFHELFKKFGFFEIKPDMIGFNSEGKLKCWLNQHFQNNRIQNANDSVLSGSDQSTTKNFDKMDKKLKQSIEKSMVSDLWCIVKKKSNIQSRDLFNKLSNLQGCNFQNAFKLVKYMINKNEQKVPQYLQFENCIEFKNHKNREFNYGDVFNEQNSVTKAVQAYDVDLVLNGILNCYFWANEPDFKDFDLYREHIQKLRPQKVFKNNQVLISFESLPKFDTKKTINSENRTEKKIEKSKLTFDKTIDISLSSIPHTPSQKTESLDSEPTIKKIETDSNQSIPIRSDTQRTYPLFNPNAVSEQYISNEGQLAQPTVVPLMRSVKVNCPIQKNVLAQHSEPVMLENYPLLYSRKISKYCPSAQMAAVVKRQPNNISFSNQRNSPQFNKVSYQ